MVLQAFALKSKTSCRDWATLIAFGAVGLLAYQLIFGVVALLVGLLVATFSKIRWDVAALISYLGLRLVVVGVDAFSRLRSTRCIACNRKIGPSKPARCEECGGDAHRDAKKKGTDSALAE